MPPSSNTLTWAKQCVIVRIQAIRRKYTEKSYELGSHGEARQHYKTAIGAQPQEQLAWKVGRGVDSWLYLGMLGFDSDFNMDSSYIS